MVTLAMSSSVVTWLPGVESGSGWPATMISAVLTMAPLALASTVTYRTMLP